MQRQAFGSLVGLGIYSVEFEHAPQATQFFSDCIADAVAAIAPSRVVSVLDCGCGTGAWLDLVHRMLDLRDQIRRQYFGFDLTPEMVEVARTRLLDRVPPKNIQEGDVLDDASYDFGEANRRFDLIYAYDLVQQLPRREQTAACEAMVKRLAAGGTLVIFDHDRWSRHGLVMGAKKFLTRYAGIGLVPRYYCNAAYPALLRICRRLQERGFDASIRPASDGKKRALIVRASNTPAITTAR